MISVERTREQAHAAPTSESESLRTVVVALAANLGIAAAKLAAALLTGSSAMLAEAFHAAADTGNQVLLLIAQHRAGRPPDEAHPVGHGREAYFWALVAALSVFVTGALASLHEGVEQLMHPTQGTSFAVAYVVLAISFALETVSLLRAARQISAEARALDRRFLEHLDLSSDPITRAVFAEDAAAVAGNVIAFVGIALHQATGSAMPDAVAAIIVGLTLGWVAFELTQRNRDFLIGRQASGPLRRFVEETITSQAGIVGVRELLVTFIGPRRVWVLARVRVDETMTAERLVDVLHATTDALSRGSVYVVRVDLVPVD